MINVGRIATVYTINNRRSRKKITKLRIEFPTTAVISLPNTMAKHYFKINNVFVLFRKLNSINTHILCISSLPP